MYFISKRSRSIKLQFVSDRVHTIKMGARFRKALYFFIAFALINSFIAKKLSSNCHVGQASDPVKQGTYKHETNLQIE